MDDRELEQAFEKFRSGVDFTDEELRKLGRGSKEFSENLKKAGLDAAKTMGRFAQGLAEGETGFKQLNPVIDGMVGALSELTKSLPFVSGAIKLVGEGAKFLIGQLQVATEAFQEISKVGGLTAKGMSGLREQFLRSGQTLQGFQKTVAANSSALANFAGNVGQGAEDFSKIVGGIIDSDLGTELRRIGFTADEIGETTAGYIAQQTRLGLAQTKTQSQLIAGSKQYAEELDILAKLTGQSRQEVQKQQDAALRESRFRAEIDELVANNSEDVARALLQLQGRFSSPEFSEIGAGLREAVVNETGEMAQRLFAATGGASRDIIDQLKARAITVDEATSQLQQALKSQLDTQRQYARAVGDGTKVFIPYNQASNAATATLENGVLVAKKTQAEQQAGTDALTNETVDAQKSLESMGRNLNKIAFTALPAAATAVNAFSTVLNQAVAKISGELGIPAPAGGGAGAAPTGGGGGGGAAPAGGGGGGGAAAAPRGLAGIKDLTGNLRIKSAEAMAGGAANPRLYALANQIQNILGEKLLYFSAFNDTYDRKNANSKHPKGLALDFVLRDPSESEYATNVVASLLGGRGRVKDEYLSPSGSATGGHIHAELDEYLRGGIATGPRSGYAAMLHGTEAVVPLPDGRNIPVNMPQYDNKMQEQLGMMGAQLAALEDLVSAMRDQNSISTKILQATNN